MPTDEKLHELLTEAAARLVYVDENTDAVNLSGAIEEIDRAHRLVRVNRRDAVTEEINDAVGERDNE